MVQPIHPSSFLTTITDHQIPDFIIVAINTLIMAKWSHNTAVFTHEQLMDEIRLKNPHIETHLIFQNRWLKFEQYYEKIGWKVICAEFFHNDTSMLLYVFSK